MEWLAKVMGKQLGIKLALVFFGIFLTLLAIEIIFRFGLISNPRYSRTLTEGERTRPKHRILILGDSFIAKESPGQELYQFLLRDLSTYQVEVLNAGGAGFGPYEYLAEMKELGVPFKPNITLLFYYVGNDLTNVQYNGQFVSEGNGVRNTLRPYVRKLYLYHFYKHMAERLTPNLFDYKKMESEGIDRRYVELAQEQKINPYLLEISLQKKDYVLDNVLLEKEESLRAFEVVKEKIRDINSLCKELDSELILVVFPHTVQINRSHFPFIEGLFNLDERTLVSERPQELLKDFCLQEKIPVLDLLPYFKAKAETDYYLVNDDHLNKDGNILAEQIIFDYLIKASSKLVR